MTRLLCLPVAAVLLVAAGPDKAMRQWAGLYDGSQTELAAALELRADGRFAFALSYGALDEAAEGRWSVEGDGIVLVVTRHESSDPDDAGFGESTLAIRDGALMLPRHGRMLMFAKRTSGKSGRP